MDKERSSQRDVGTQPGGSEGHPRGCEAQPEGVLELGSKGQPGGLRATPGVQKIFGCPKTCFDFLISDPQLTHFRPPTSYFRPLMCPFQAPNSTI